MSNANLNHAVIDGVLLVVPTREQVQGLKVGDLAPDCFGRWNVVTRVFGSGDDVSGKAYVCFYTQWGERGEVSNSLNEGEPCLTVAATAKWHRSDNYPKI